MRTVKASEVVKGMRVRFEASNGDATVTTEGVVSEVLGEYAVSVCFGSYCISLHPDHPVTVLAEPEPEWVEGAWYRTEVRHKAGRTLRKRGEDGWLCAGEDDHDFRFNDAAIIVLGRVLIVDWPGDDVARAIERTYTPGGNWIATENTAAQIVADAIRTQGGVR